MDANTAPFDRLLLAFEILRFHDAIDVGLSLDLNLIADLDSRTPSSR